MSSVTIFDRDNLVAVVGVVDDFDVLNVLGILGVLSVLILTTVLNIMYSSIGRKSHKMASCFLKTL